MKGWLLLYNLILTIQVNLCSNFDQILFVIQRRILRWIEEYEAEEDSKKQSSLQFVILEMSGKVKFRMNSILELCFQIDVVYFSQ